MKVFTSYLWLILVVSVAHSQNVLQIVKEKPFTYKTYELYTNDVIEYKLKGDRRFKKDIILNMGGDHLLLQNDSIIYLSQIRTIRFRRPNHLLKTLNAVCFIGGVGYVGLNVINNALLEDQFKVDEKALYVAGGFIAAGIIIKLTRVKHIRIRSKTSLKIITTNYQNLGK